MKWIRWDGERWFDLRDAKPSSQTDTDYKEYLEEDWIDCEKDSNWREIESFSGPVNGKLKITLKPVVQKEQVANVEIRFPAKGDHDSLVVYGFCNDGSFCRTVAHRDSRLWREVFGAENEFGNVSRATEASTPANPYTKEAVDDLLDAAREANDLWFTETNWTLEENKRISRAFLALKKQREAANGG